MGFHDNTILESIYSELIEEGIEEKIPKLLNFVPDHIEDKESYIIWAAETFDPTKNSAYITWILRMLKKGVLAGEEDGAKVKERLGQFTDLKRKPQFPADKRDINRFKTYGDLAETIDEFSGIKTKGEEIRAAREEGIEYVDQYGESKLYIVTTSEAGAKYFRQTDWCVKDPRYFDQYGAPYYFFTDLDDQPETLLHLGSSQLMDVRDRPTDLDGDQQELMSSERMTNYVMENDDGGLAFYTTKVGEGYDGQIGSLIIEKIDAAITEANKNMKMFQIDEMYGEELEYYEPQASGYIEYDMTPYEEHIGDRDFLKVVSEVLSHEDIYPEDFEYGEPIDEDLKGIRMNLRYENDNYRQESVTEKIESFANELSRTETSFDIESFDEKFKEKMLEAGYISSGWADFTNRVDIENLSLTNFQKSRFDKKYSTPTITIIDEIFKNISSFDVVDVEAFLEKNKRHDHPYVLLAEFLKPFLKRGLMMKIGRAADKITFEYEPKHAKDKSGKQYIRGLKAIKDFDTHFEFYVEQIKRFASKYMTPYFKNDEDHGAFNIPEEIKLPFIQLKGRKESSDQMMLDLHENRFARFIAKNGIKF